MDSIDLVKDLSINVDCFSWECPHCKRITTIDKHNIHFSDNFLLELNVEEDTGFNVQTKNIICPNHQCKNISIYVSVFKAKRIYKEMDIIRLLMNNLFLERCFFQIKI